MSIEEGYKRIYADDLAVGLGFEWDFENANDDDLYDAIEAIGYIWDGVSWVSSEQRRRDAARRRASNPKKPRRQKVDIQEQLRQWNAGKPIGASQ